MSPGLIDKLPTPDPGEFSLRVWVPSEKIVPAHLPTAGTTTYREFKMHPTPNRAEGYASYVYTYASGPRDDGAIGFHFAKPKTDAEKYTPFRDPRIETDEYFWPSVLEDWTAAPDPTLAIEQRDPAGNQVYSMRWNARYRLRGYAHGSTQFEIFEYVAPTPFTLQKPVILQPVPFNWKLPGDEEDIGRVLIASRVRRPDKVLGPSVLQSTVFDPTSPPGWTRHLADTDQKQTEAGVWHMWEKYAIPPTTGTFIRFK